MSKLNIIPEQQEAFLNLISLSGGSVFDIEYAGYSIKEDGVSLLFDSKTKPVDHESEFVEVFLDESSVDFLAAHFGFMERHYFLLTMNKPEYVKHREMVIFSEKLCDTSLRGSLVNYLVFTGQEVVL